MKPRHNMLAGLAAIPLSVAAPLSAEPQPDFSLTDVNPNSERASQPISPRDYRGQISVWYFGREW